MSIANEIRVIANDLLRKADELDGIQPPAPAPAHEPPVPYPGPALPLDAANVFLEDYWVVNKCGAMKGTLLEHYSEGQQIMSMAGAYTYIPAHMTVFKPAPKGSAWTASLDNAAGVGWIDGSHYAPPNPPKQNLAPWIAAGCPSYARDGKPLNAMGDYRDMTGTFSPG